jgi:hypothetical protein
VWKKREGVVLYLGLELRSVKLLSCTMAALLYRILKRCLVNTNARPNIT